MIGSPWYVSLKFYYVWHKIYLMSNIKYLSPFFSPILFTVSVDGLSEPMNEVLGHIIARLTEVRSRIEGGGRHETG
jgi:hypothetical protein